MVYAWDNIDGGVTGTMEKLVSGAEMETLVMVLGQGTDRGNGIKL